MKCVNIRRMIVLLWPIDLRLMLDPVVPNSISRPAAQTSGRKSRLGEDIYGGARQDESMIDRMKEIDESLCENNLSFPCGCW
jgi:hypothetical protein